jgi:serine/threonine protein kinase
MQVDSTQANFVDFIDRCIEWKPEKRLKPHESFNHPWIINGLKEIKNMAGENPKTLP